VEEPQHPEEGHPQVNRRAEGVTLHGKQGPRPSAIPRPEREGASLAASDARAATKRGQCDEQQTQHQ
jgi:hypothetical protein